MLSSYYCFYFILKIYFYSYIIMVRWFCNNLFPVLISHFWQIISRLFISSLSKYIIDHTLCVSICMAVSSNRTMERALRANPVLYCNPLTRSYLWTSLLHQSAIFGLKLISIYFPHILQMEGHVSVYGLAHPPCLFIFPSHL